MKKFLFLLMMSVLIAACCSNVNAQNTVQQQTVNVPVDQLTPAQLLKIQNDAKIAELQKKVETYGNWVGVGGEIGTAVKEGLNAVIDVSDKFSKTDVGKFTLVMVAYKIMGRDFIRIIIGILFFIVYTFFIFKCYRNAFIPRRIPVKDNGWRFWLPKEYQVIEPKRYEGFEAVKVLYIGLMLGGFGITYAIMFA